MSNKSNNSNQRFNPYKRWGRGFSSTGRRGNYGQPERVVEQAPPVQYDYIRHVYGPTKLFHSNWWSNVQQKMVNPYEIEMGACHEANSGHCRFTTCPDQQTHYHYIIRFNPEYMQECTRCHRHVLHCIRNIINIENISHKKIVSTVHYNNTIKYLENYKPIEVVNEDLTDDDGETIQSISELSGTTNSYVNDDELIKCAQMYENTKKRKLDEPCTSAQAEVSNKRKLPTPTFKLDDKIKRQRTLVTTEMLNDALEKGEAIRTNGNDEQELYDSMLNYNTLKKKYEEQQQALALFNMELDKYKPLSDYELEVMAYDLTNKMSTFRAFHIIDVLNERKSHSVRSDKIPIFILVGEASCGKSKIAQYVANVIGRSNKPIVNYKFTDNLALHNWAKSGSNILVFDDFNFTSTTRKDEPSQIFGQLKSWASGIPIDIRTALNSKGGGETNVMIEGIFISVNNISKEASKCVQTMPEFKDRLEVLPFGPLFSYAKPEYIKLYNDSVNVADRCMTAYTCAYSNIRGNSTWAEFYNKLQTGELDNLSDKTESNIVKHIKSIKYPANYPYSHGLYHPDITSQLNG